MAKEITKPFTGIGDLLSKLNSESKLLTEMYHYRTRLEFSYSHALELASSEKRLQMLIEYGILHRDGDNLEIDELFLRFFEEVLQSSEDISNATVEENLTKLQKNIEYYQKEQNNTEGQRYYLRMIRRGLVVIGSMVRRNVVTLKRNIDDVYKTIGNYATKRMRLEEYMQQLRSISLLIDETRKILKREDTTFRVMIPDERLLHIIAEVHSDMQFAFENVIELERVIRDYLHQIDVQTRTLNKIRKLKYLKDMETWRSDSDVEAVLSRLNAVWMEREYKRRIKPSLSYITTTTEGISVLEQVQKILSKGRRDRRVAAPPLGKEQLAALKIVEDIVDTDRLATAFMASGRDLFDFVINYHYETPQPLDRRLEYYAEIVQGYLGQLRFTGEWRDYEQLRYPIIYAR